MGDIARDDQGWPAFLVLAGHDHAAPCRIVQDAMRLPRKGVSWSGRKGVCASRFARRVLIQPSCRVTKSRAKATLPRKGSVTTSSRHPVSAARCSVSHAGSVAAARAVSRRRLQSRSPRSSPRLRFRWWPKQSVENTLEHAAILRRFARCANGHRIALTMPLQPVLP